MSDTFGSDKINNILLIISIIFCLACLIFSLFTSDSERYEKLEGFATDAYVYAYPLVTMEVTRRKLAYNNMNKFISMPDKDSLYSYAFLDLSQSPLKLSIPIMESKYFVLQFFDARGNVFASVGSRTIDTSKSHEFTISTDQSSKVDIVSPTNLVYVTANTYRDGTEKDIQPQYVITQTKPWEIVTETPLLYEFYPSDSIKSIVDNMSAEAYYYIFTLIMNKNSFNIDKELELKLKYLGLTKEFSWEKYYDQGKAVLEKSMKTGLEKLESEKIKLSQNEQDIMHYYIKTDEQGNPLSGNYDYMIKFDKQPPVNGFWSLSTDEPLSNQYSIGTKNKLSFPVEIQISSQKRDDKTLIVPRGNYILDLKLYWPKAEAIRSWNPPTVRVI